MRKRITSLFLVLALCLSLLPTAALAAENEGGESGESHTHCVCGAEHHDVGDHETKEEITFTEWTDELVAEQYSGEKTAANSLPKDAGNYYLTTDVTIVNAWTPRDGTVLDLNGHSITMKAKGPVINVTGSFTLTDCKGGKDTNPYGKITHNRKKPKVDYGSGVYMEKKGASFTPYSGEISSHDSNNNGGGVFLGSSNSPHTLNGTIGGI